MEEGAGAPGGGGTAAATDARRRSWKALLALLLLLLLIAAIVGGVLGTRRQKAKRGVGKSSASQVECHPRTVEAPLDATNLSLVHMPRFGCRSF
jgi:hypothetical protein